MSPTSEAFSRGSEIGQPGLGLGFFGDVEPLFPDASPRCGASTPLPWPWTPAMRFSGQAGTQGRRLDAGPLRTDKWRWLNQMHPNGTRVNGNKDQNLHTPSSLILSHTQILTSVSIYGCGSFFFSRRGKPQVLVHVSTYRGSKLVPFF